MSTNKKFINILFDIFGYSFVGILAYFFGIVLQNYNSGNDRLLSSVINYSSEGCQIVLIIIVQIVLILFFGHAYATIVLSDDPKSDDAKNKTDICNIVGHWIETIFVSVIVFIALFQVVSPSQLSIYFWLTLLSTVIIYILNLVAYRIKLKKHPDYKKTAKYALFCPALLMIGVNIYLGSNITAFLNGNFFSFLPLIMFFVLYLAIYLIDGKNINIVYFLFIICTLATGFFAISSSLSESVKLVLKNLFLSIVVTVFLSIFESWYVSFRQLKEDTKKSYAKVSSFVIILMPPVVFLLFPIQEFNLIYFITFCFGMLYTEWVWFTKVLQIINSDNSNDENARKSKRKIAVSRALCGICTLIFLMLDKYFPLSVPVKLAADGLIKASAILPIITVALSVIEILCVVFGISKIKINENKPLSLILKDENGNLKIYGYMLYRLLTYCLVIFLSFVLYSYIDIDPNKSYLSSIAMIAFWVIENVYILYSSVLSTKANENK